MTYVFYDKAPFSYSDEGRPIQLDAAAVDEPNAEPLHDGQAVESGGRQESFEELYIYLTNRHASTAAIVFVCVGGSDGGLRIVQTVPAGETIPLYQDGRALSIFGAYDVRAYATGPGANNVSVMGHVQRARWEE